VKSVAKCNYHLNHLRKLLARAPDDLFLQMVWAVDALQSDRVEAAKKYIAFPADAAGTAIDGKYAVHRWELETLLIQLLLTRKQEKRPGRNLVLDCSNFGSIIEAINRLRKLEDVEAEAYLLQQNIFSEMHRIAHRQFHWQRGYFNTPQMYLYSYLYGQGQCGDHFKEKYALQITDLTLVGFALWASMQGAPWVHRGFMVPEVGLTGTLVQRALPMLSLPISRARMETETIIRCVNEMHGSPIPTAYLPSILRRYPLIWPESDLNLYVAPIPELILLRVTAGLYYDLIEGGQALLNEANDRFEQYCVDYIQAMLPRFTVSRSFRYGPKGAQVDSPDVLIKHDGKLVIAGECKATKLTYLAQFAENPFDAGKKQYEQLARGVLQLWRYFSHVRQGVVQEEFAPESYAMLLTLDSFLALDPELLEKVLKEANARANEDGGILADDRRSVVFCPIQDLEHTLAIATEDTFLAALKAAKQKNLSGWQLREIYQKIASGNGREPKKKYPFVLNTVLPWWERTQRLRARASVQSLGPRDTEKEEEGNHFCGVIGVDRAT
jgi:hypothetical protein